MECFQLGVSAACGTVDLFKHPKNSGGHSIHYHHGNAVSIETVDLDWILSKFDGEADLLKMDCEGCERDFVRSYACPRPAHPPYHFRTRVATVQCGRFHRPPREPGLLREAPWNAESRVAIKITAYPR